ncbi:MAG: DUF2183 domain-containing protein [Bacteriovoracaceae bacterium]|nr:DUF2183 domain-containing protein [Bacteriovoracaceae bacterium]
MKLANILLFVLIFATQLIEAKVFVISDIDDTIKKANSANGGIGQAYHFFKKRIYPEMRDLFNELESGYEKLGEEVEFYYVSAAPDALFQQDKWINKNKFPKGQAILRRPGDGDTYEYKTNTIGAILKAAKPTDTIYLFGDNSSKDAIVYKELTEKLGLVNSFIYIRDVETDATFWNTDLPVNQLAGVNYFFSERELIGEEGLFFMTEKLIKTIMTAYADQRLVPKYTLKTLEKRLRKEWGCGLNFGCRCTAENESEKLWQDYYTRL